MRAFEDLRVLVIEDEDAIRSFLEIALTSLGYHARLAADGEEGLAIFAGEPFDLVLTDVGLPGINGEEVARIINQRSPGTPVVLLTGWAEQISTQIGTVEGVTRVLGKPIELKTLAAMLAEVVPVMRTPIRLRNE